MTRTPTEKDAAPRTAHRHNHRACHEVAKVAKVPIRTDRTPAARMARSRRLAVSTVLAYGLGCRPGGRDCGDWLPWSVDPPRPGTFAQVSGFYERSSMGCSRKGGPCVHESPGRGL